MFGSSSGPLRGGSGGRARFDTGGDAGDTGIVVVEVVEVVEEVEEVEEVDGLREMSRRRPRAANRIAARGAAINTVNR